MLHRMLVLLSRGAIRPRMRGGLLGLPFRLSPPSASAPASARLFRFVLVRLGSYVRQRWLGSYRGDEGTLRPQCLQLPLRQPAYSGRTPGVWRPNGHVLLRKGHYHHHPGPRGLCGGASSDDIPARPSGVMRRVLPVPRRWFRRMGQAQRVLGVRMRGAGRRLRGYLQPDPDPLRPDHQHNDHPGARQLLLLPVEDQHPVSVWGLRASRFGLLRQRATATSRWGSGDLRRGCGRQLRLCVGPA